MTHRLRQLSLALIALALVACSEGASTDGSRSTALGGGGGRSPDGAGGGAGGLPVGGGGGGGALSSPPDEDAGVPDAPEDAPAPYGYQEVYDQGLTAYAGTEAVQPSSVTNPLLFPNIDVHHFDTEERGPICMYGDEFKVETREGESDDLMIFLQGGGVCLEEICAATPYPILTMQLMVAGDIAGVGGIFDKNDEENPFADFDMVNVPYCDGSIYMGDVDRTLSDGNALNGEDDPAYQRGLLNLTAAFEVAKSAFPNPSRVVLMGSSGGSYGTLLGVAFARYYFGMDVDLLTVSDSGAPILTDEDPDFIHRVLEELDATHLVPASCVGCLDDGHATGVVDWALDRDPNLRVAYMGHSQDHVIGEFFMGSSVEGFEAAVLRETAWLLEQHPDRIRRFIVPSSRHTLLMDVDSLPENLQMSFLGLFGPLALTGDDATNEELATWTLGGLRVEAENEDGEVITGREWLRQLVEENEMPVNVVQPGP